VIGGAGVIGDYAMAEVVGLLLLRGKNVENGGKRVKKVVKTVCLGISWRLVCVLKKVVKFFGRPLSIFLNTPQFVMVMPEICSMTVISVLGCFDVS
jgi:hypothetical protein